MILNSMEKLSVCESNYQESHISIDKPPPKEFNLPLLQGFLAGYRKGSQSLHLVGE